MASSTMTFNTEIRKLKPAHRCTLGDILNVSNSWKKLMAIIPRNDTNTMRFNSEHVSIFEQMARKSRHNAAEILLDEWGTMGRERPTLQVLLDLLIKAELFRAADYVASEILNVDLPQRPEYGPAAVVDISDETLAKLISQQAKLYDSETKRNSNKSYSMSYHLKPEIESCMLPIYAVDREENDSDLHRISNSNAHTPISDYLPLTVIEYNK